MGPVTHVLVSFETTICGDQHIIAWTGIDRLLLTGTPTCIQQPILHHEHRVRPFVQTHIQYHASDSSTRLFLLTPLAVCDS